MDRVTRGLGALTLACLLAIGFWHYSRAGDPQSQRVQAAAQVGAASDPSSR